MRLQGVADGLVALDAVLAETAAELDVQPAADGGEVRFGVELDGVDAV